MNCLLRNDMIKIRMFFVYGNENIEQVPKSFEIRQRIRKPKSDQYQEWSYFLDWRNMNTKGGEEHHHEYDHL